MKKVVKRAFQNVCTFEMRDFFKRLKVAQVSSETIRISGVDEIFLLLNKGNMISIPQESSI